MTESTKSLYVNGRAGLLVASINVVGVTVATIVSYLLAIGPNNLLSQIIRLFLTVLLLKAVFEGSAFAKRLAVFLFVVGVLGFAFLALTPQPVNWIFRLTCAANAATYALYLNALLRSEEVKVYLRVKHSRRLNRV